MPAIFIVLATLFISAALTLYFAWTVWQAILATAGMFIAINALLVVFLFFLSITRKARFPVERQSKLCRFCCSAGAELICIYSMIKVRISGEDKLPKDRRFLLVSNHRSAYDPLIFVAKLPKYNISFVAKPSVAEHPILAGILQSACHLPIDRENNRNALKTIQAAAGYIKNDLCSISIFPEGTRSKNNELLPFHHGSFKIAQKARAPLVIAAIQSTENISKNVLRRITRVSVSILETLPAEKVCSMSSSELANYSTKLIKNFLDGSEK